MPRVLQNDDVDYCKFEFTGREMIHVCFMGSLKVKKATSKKGLMEEVH